MAAMVATVCNTIDIMINTLSTIRQTFKRLNCSALSYKNTQIFRILPVALRKKRQPEATESGIPGPESEGGNYGDGGRERGRQTGEQQMDGRAADGTCMAYVITVADRRAAAADRRSRRTSEAVTLSCPVGSTPATRGRAAAAYRLQLRCRTEVIRRAGRDG